LQQHLEAARSTEPASTCALRDATWQFVKTPCLLAAGFMVLQDIFMFAVPLLMQQLLVFLEDGGDKCELAVNLGLSEACLVNSSPLERTPIACANIPPTDRHTLAAATQTIQLLVPMFSVLVIPAVLMARGRHLSHGGHHCFGLRGGNHEQHAAALHKPGNPTDPSAPYICKAALICPCMGCLATCHQGARSQTRSGAAPPY
jgi:hypothetical protein